MHHPDNAIRPDRPKPIQIEICCILPLFAHFHANTVSYSSFLDRLVPLVGMTRTASPSNALLADAIQFEEMKASQSDGGGSFTLSLYASVKVSLMMISSIGMNAGYSRQHRGYRHQ
jgi:hypothetical protein